MSQGFWTLLICAKWPTCTKSLHTWCCSQYACSFHVLPHKMIVRNHQSSGYLQTWTRQDTLFQWKPPPAEFRQLGQYKRVVSAKISKVGPKAKGLHFAFTCIILSQERGCIWLHSQCVSWCYPDIVWRPRSAADVSGCGLSKGRLLWAYALKLVLLSLLLLMS